MRAEPAVRPRLGLVCITDSDLVRFRRMTRKRYLQHLHAGEDALRHVLDELYRANLARFNRAITFCLKQNIRLYRATSHLFPFSDEPIGRAVLDALEPELRRAGRRVTEDGIRLVLHPDQFVVLNSDRPEVIENSIAIMEHHALVFDLLEQPRSAWATMILHGGKGGRAERLVEVVGRLPENVRARLALENDERSYGADQILEVCRAAGVPMVFDAHHHVVREKLEDFEDPSIAEYLEVARDTWPDPSWQLVHISNGRGAVTDPRHSDVIETMPSAYRHAPWIEVEAKRKEVAIAKLQHEWLPSLDAPAGGDGVG